MTEIEKDLSILLKNTNIGKKTALFAIVATETEEQQHEMIDFLIERLNRETMEFSLTDEEVIAKAKELNPEMDWM